VKAAEQLATFDGQTVDESDLPTAEQAQLQNMMQQVFAVRMRGLHGVLDKKLIAAEAARRGVSVEELFKTEVVAKAAEPSEDEVKAYYQSRQVQYKTQPYDSVKDEIRQGLKNVAIKKAEGVYVQGLMQQAVNDGKLVFLITPAKTDLNIDPERLRGDPQAPITIVEFSDFSCAACKKAEATVNKLLAEYPGKLKVGYRDFPLVQLYSQGGLAAEASRCAGEQGKYWEYHDLLFASDKQGRDDLIENARRLKLDDKEFDACLTSGRNKVRVDQDIQLGTRDGVITTPWFFVNGVPVHGAEPAALEMAVRERMSGGSAKSSASRPSK
jgi:protein-disulfide isomerase